jgi:transglutaminase-like putative cysteine protease
MARPRRSGGRSNPGRRADDSGGSSNRAWFTAGRIVALALVNLAAAVSLSRLFTGSKVVVDIAAVVLIAHFVPPILRLMKVPLPICTGLSFLAALGVSSRRLFPETVRSGLIPTSLTWEQGRQALDLARATFGTVVAPVDPIVGFVMLAVASAWVVAATADLVAFPGQARLEPLVPGSAMFIFAAALAPRTDRAQVVALFTAAAGAYVMVTRLEELADEPWLAPRRTSDAVRAGLGALGVTAIAIGVAVASIAPAETRVEDGMVDWRSGRERVAARELADREPMVTVRSRLVDQSTRTMFTARPVVSGVSFGLWRQRALERFDGVSWGPQSRPDPVGTRAGPQTLETLIEVGALRGSAIPTPGYPLAVLDGVGAETKLAGIDDASESAIAPNGLRNEDQWRVRWTSRPNLLQLGPDRSLELFSLTPREVTRLTEVPLPEAERSALRSLAVQITAGESNPVDQAIALQAWFLREFTYDLDVASSGVGATSVSEFVTETRRGYCEQFASAYATMARLLDIPARVVVGFSRGTPKADGSEVIEGRHAHAWVEVFAPGTPGWVTVDPTPGQGLNSNSPRPNDEPVAASTTTIAAPTTTTPQQTPTTSPASATTRPNDDPDRVSPPSKSTAGSIGGPILRVMAFIAALLAVSVLARLVELVRRGPLGSSPDDIAERGWARVEDAIAWAGTARLPGEGLVGFAQRVRQEGHIPSDTADLVVSLAHQLNSARYGPEGGSGSATGSTSADDVRDVADIRKAITSGLPWPRRLQAALWPRLRPSLRPSTQGAHRQTQGKSGTNQRTLGRSLRRSVNRRAR